MLVEIFLILNYITQVHAPVTLNGLNIETSEKRSKKANWDQLAGPIDFTNIEVGALRTLHN
jgi:hypothetical protein